MRNDLSAYFTVLFIVIVGLHIFLLNVLIQAVVGFYVDVIADILAIPESAIGINDGNFSNFDSIVDLKLY